MLSELLSFLENYTSMVYWRHFCFSFQIRRPNEVNQMRLGNHLKDLRSPHSCSGWLKRWCLDVEYFWTDARTRSWQLGTETLDLKCFQFLNRPQFYIWSLVQWLLALWRSILVVLACSNLYCYFRATFVNRSWQYEINFCTLWLGWAIKF